MKKITIDKIVALCLPIAWFTLLWNYPILSPRFHAPVSACVGAAVGILWRFQKDKKESFESGQMQERYIHFCEKHNIDPKDCK